jgi:hypothetical protein
VLSPELLSPLHRIQWSAWDLANVNAHGWSEVLAHVCAFVVRMAAP